MSRILLISANTTREPLPVYPLGIALVDAALTARGHETRQIDLLRDLDSAPPSLERELAAFSPEFVGISIRNIDNVDSLSPDANWYIDDIRKLVKRVRESWKGPVIFGGPAFSIMPEIILDYAGGDYGIVGEGEVAFNLLVEQVNRGETPPRITGPLPRQMDAQDFHAPAYEQGLVNFYLDQTGMVNYQTKRGCPFGCNYCSYPLIEGRKFRFQDPGFVAENLSRLKKDHGADTVFFTDSVFNDPGGRYLEVAEALVRKNTGIRWAAYFRPDKISQENLALLKASGLYAMEVGSDAACDTTLAGINKTFGFDRIMAFNEACIRAKIPCAHFFMFGGPGETQETIDEGLANISRLRQTVVFAFSGIRILPDTGIEKIARKEGIIKESATLLRPEYYVSARINKARMDRQLENAFLRKKDRFFPPEKGQVRINALKVFGFKGLLWDMLLQTQPARKRSRKMSTTSDKEPTGRHHGLP